MSEFSILKRQSVVHVPLQLLQIFKTFQVAEYFERLFKLTSNFYKASTANIQAKNILQGHTGNITSLAFQSSIQWLFTASTDGTVRIWDFPGLKCQKEFKNKTGINGAVLHPNQAEIVIGDEAGFVRVLDLLKGTFTIDMVD